MNNKDAVKLITQLKKFCENQKCNNCCFANEEDGHCMITDDTPDELDIETFKKQEKDLL